MEKKEHNLNDKKSSLSLENRKKLNITGIIEVISFNEDEIKLNTTLGTLDIKGSSLKMNKLDVQNGQVIIIGSINSCVYTNSQLKRKRHRLISKIFK
ncbi:sporulation protein YabP [Clostridium sp. cel8]|jgi:sporulation protein YabP|uniref:sporulation protein YabP n=1 Tax=unclassified Clostridium TaxID=2614128 RepID=UPI0015F438F4|nr:sporulation protein YabP [Clostridium sp. cel8]MBA5851979.1 sporulation protein YabP [Clostridium sp. cel8]